MTRMMTITFPSQPSSSSDVEAVMIPKMKTLFVFLAAVVCAVFVEGQTVEEAIECPFPDGSSVESVTECAKYSACAWSGTRCHMQTNDLAGYKATSDPQSTGRGYTVSLQKSDPLVTLFEQDIQDLVFEVIDHEDYHVQVKLYDPNNARFEVPVPIYTPDTAGTSPMYTVSASAQDTPFEFSVTRNSNENTLFSTVGPITFEDQFLQVTVALPSSFVYGFGENAHSTFKHNFDSRVTTPLFSRDQPVGDDDWNQYGVHAYYVNIEDDSGNTHSVLLRTSNAMEYVTFSLDDGTPAITLRTIGGILDFHFFLGPTPEEVNAQYAGAIGLPSHPPYYAFGFHLSRYGYDTLDNLRTVRQRMKDAGIPQDVQTCDIDYMYRYRDFTYDQVSWSGFPEFVDELHADTVKVTLILDPALVIDWDNYSPSYNGREQDVFVKWMNESLIPDDQEEGAQDYMVGYVWPDTKTVFPDFMLPTTVDWWSSECAIFHDTLAFDSLWIDMNEPANFGTNTDRPFNYPPELPDWSLKCPFNNYDSPPFPTKAAHSLVSESKRLSDKTLCMSGVHSDGTTTYLHYDVHSLYGYYQAVATQNAMDNIFPGKRHLILSRSTYPGSGQFVTHWLGDNTATWEQLRKSIVGMLEFNLFIIPNVGADVCGFFSEPSEELCARWMQLGAFYPFDRNHNTLGEPDQDPARPDWPTVNQVSRDVLLLRYKYIPYLYTLFHKVSMHGGSVVRPLFNLFPSDIPAREIDDQFFWGDGLMVAPVVYEGASSRDVYFPQGEYYDLVNGNLVSSGSETLTIDAPIDQIPVYSRGGVILPYQKPNVTTALSRVNPFGLTISLNTSTGTASGDLFWDDGESITDMDSKYMSVFSYDNGVLSSTIKHGEAVVAGLSFDQFAVYGHPSNPASITVDGVAQDSSTWSYDDSIQVLTISVDIPLDTAFEVVIS